MEALLDAGCSEDTYSVRDDHGGLHGLKAERYDSVGEALLWTLDYGLGEAFTPEVKKAWGTLYTLVAKTMKLSRAAANVNAQAHPLPTQKQRPQQARGGVS